MKQRLVKTAFVGVLVFVIAMAPAGAFAAKASRTTTTTAPPRASGPEVDSWALAPASTGTADTGNRPALSYDAAAGTVIKDVITLYNLGNAQLTFRLYSTDAFNSPDGSFNLLPGDQHPQDVGSWITLPQPNITVPARKQATMPIEISVPPDARPGDHVGAILASNAAAGTGPNGKTITVDRRTGTRIYVRVAGPVVPELSVERIKERYRPSLNPLGGGADVTYRVRNTGNVRLSVRQAVTVSGPLGLLARHARPKQLAELLPGQRATMTVHVHGAAALGLSTATVGVEAADVAQSSSEKPARSTRRAVVLAPPIALFALTVIAWLLLRSWRAYRRHLDEPVPTSRRELEAVGTP